MRYQHELAILIALQAMLWTSGCAISGDGFWFAPYYSAFHHRATTTTTYEPFTLPDGTVENWVIEETTVWDTDATDSWNAKQSWRIGTSEEMREGGASGVTKYGAQVWKRSFDSTDHLFAAIVCVGSKGLACQSPGGGTMDPGLLERAREMLEEAGFEVPDEEPADDLPDEELGFFGSDGLPLGLGVDP